MDRRTESQILCPLAFLRKGGGQTIHIKAYRFYKTEANSADPDKRLHI